jgi:hypothetical protein
MAHPPPQTGTQASERRKLTRRANHRQRRETAPGATDAKGPVSPPSPEIKTTHRANKEAAFRRGRPKTRIFLQSRRRGRKRGGMPTPPPAEKWATADRGAWAEHEKHAFRIGREIPDAVEFRARRDDFPSALADALLDHAQAHGARRTLNLQVLTTASWRNIQNPSTGNVMAVTPAIAGERASCVQLFDWACNAVMMARDLDALAGKMAE